MLLFALLAAPAQAHDCVYTGTPSTYVRCIATALQDTEDLLGLLDEAVTALTGRVDALECPSDYLKIGVGRLCIHESGLLGAANMASAVSFCGDLSNGHVCSHAELMQACSEIDPFLGSDQGWYADPAGPNQFYTWTADGCDGPSVGDAVDWDGIKYFRCCQ